MIYLLYGDEEFLAQQELARLKAGMGPADMLDLNTARLDGASVPFPEFEAAVCTIPFMAEHRLVLVEGLLTRFQGRGTSQSADDEEPAPAAVSRRGKLDAGWDGLGDLLGRLPETTELVLMDGLIDTRNALLKLFTPVAEVRMFRRLRGPALADWVRERATSHGCKLAPNALRLLLDLAGDNLRLLDAELQKLALYANGETVDETAVRALTPLSAEATIFAVVDAVVERRLTTAQRELHHLLDGGAAPTYILFMLARQTRLVLQARDLLSERLPQQEMQRRLGIFSDYPFKKTVEQAQRADTARLIRSMGRLLEADVQMKTGQFDPAVALELLVTELCGAPAERR